MIAKQKNHYTILRASYKLYNKVMRLTSVCPS